MSIINDDGDPNRTQSQSPFRGVMEAVASSLGRPTFDITDNQDLKALTDTTMRLLVRTNTGPHGPDLFQRGGEIVRIERGDNGEPVIREMSQFRMIHRLAEKIDWIKDFDGELKSVKPPNDVAANVLATPNPPFPILNRVVQVPIFCRDGHLHDAGYCEMCRVLYVPRSEWQGMAPSESPKASDVAGSRKLLGSYPKSAKGFRAL